MYRLCKVCVHTAKRTRKLAITAMRKRRGNWKPKKYLNNVINEEFQQHDQWSVSAQSIMCLANMIHWFLEMQMHTHTHTHTHTHYSSEHVGVIHKSDGDILLSKEYTLLSSCRHLGRVRWALTLIKCTRGRYHNIHKHGLHKRKS